MRWRWSVVTGSIMALALCAGLLAQAQNQKAAPPGGQKTDAKPAPSPEAVKKVEKPAAASTPEPSSPAQEDNAQEEQAIRASADAFSELYNKHDASALAALFAEKAEMVDEDGKLVKGRAEIEAEFAQQFRDQPECTMRVEIDSVRVLTPHLALEEGVARCAATAGQPEEVTNYICVHVKTGDKWVLASVTDYAAIPENLTPHEHLLELAWMLGEWVDESPDISVHSACDWDDSGNFLISHFQVQFAGRPTMFGTTRIGRDAVTKQFRSWVFDSEGGFTHGSWISQGDEWIVKMHGSTPDGETCSSTNVYRLLDQDTYTFRSYDRIVDGQLTPDIDEVVIKRQAPPPADQNTES